MSNAADFSKLAWITAVLCCKEIDSDTVRKVIVHLGMTANRYGDRVYKPTADLMADLDVSESTVTRARRDAVKYGLIAVTRKARTGQGGNKSAEYRLLHPAVSTATVEPIAVQPDGKDGYITVQPDRNGEGDYRLARLPIASSQTAIPPSLPSGETTPLGSTSLGTALGKEPPTPVAHETGPGDEGEIVEEWIEPAIDGDSIAPSELPLAPTRDGRTMALERARATNLTARSAAAHDLAQKFSQWLPEPIEGGVLARVAVEIDKCMSSGISAKAIAEGLKAWNASDSWSPTQIPIFVNKANNRRAHSTSGKPTEKALGWEAAGAELLAEMGG